MRMIFFACCMVALSACNNEADKPLPASQVQKKDSRYSGTLAKCKNISIDTLKVFSLPSMGTFNTGSDGYPYSGELIDSAEEALFPTEVAAGAIGNFTGIYACYVFAIDDDHTGIIARTSTFYESTSIKLFTLDKRRDTLTGFVELAELWYDSGELFEKTSWLYKDENNKLKAFMWVQQTYERDQENVKPLEKQEHQYVLDLSKPKYDTINTNAGDLLKTFRAVNRK